MFDGRGHTISELTIRNGDQYSGLFGHTSYAKISNVNLTGVDIRVVDQYVGARAGGLFGINNGTIKAGVYLGGTLDNGINFNDATQIFNFNAPEGVTSTSLITLNGTKYIKSGNAILKYGYRNYFHTVTGDVTVTLDDNKFFVNGTALVPFSNGNVTFTINNSALTYESDLPVSEPVNSRSIIRR